MSDISAYLEKIKSAIYGEEVRGAIHDSIKMIDSNMTDFTGQRYCKSVNQKRPDTNGGITIGAVDIDVQIRSTQFQGDLQDALNNVLATKEDLKTQIEESIHGAIAAAY